jgi:hypothetical protein
MFDESVAYADEHEEVGGTMLGEAPTPSVERLNADPEFEAEEIGEADFQKLWARLVFGLCIEGILLSEPSWNQSNILTSSRAPAFTAHGQIGPKF